MFDCFEEQKALVTELVNIRSVVGSEGCEQAMADFLYGKHPAAGLAEGIQFALRLFAHPP